MIAAILLLLCINEAENLTLPPLKGEVLFCHDDNKMTERSISQIRGYLIIILRSFVCFDNQCIDLYCNRHINSFI